MISLSQPMYIENILRGFEMKKCNPGKTPFETGTKFLNYQRMKNMLIKIFIGKLLAL